MTDPSYLICILLPSRCAKVSWLYNMNLNCVNSVRCVLEPEGDTRYCTVNLEHLKKRTVGRTPETLVDDVRVSRTQVSVVADFDKEEVSITRLGRNLSFLDGACLDKEVVYRARNNSLLELAENGCKYRVKFHKIPPNVSPKGGVSTKNQIRRSDASPPAKKMKCSDDDSAQQSTDHPVWIETRKALLLCKYGPVDQRIYGCQRRKELIRVASFDLDGTIIKTKSGKVHPKGPTDWMLWNDVVPSSLRKLHEDGYLIVFFSNQASLNYQDNIAPFKSKIEAILAALKTPMIVMISTKDDYYRKPAPGMWFYLKDDILGAAECSMIESFFVGDAAGRVAGWKFGKSKDFSISDRLFALNVKLKFLTPEEFFLREKEGRFSEPEFLPGDYDENHDADAFFKDVPTTKSEVIVMVGLPASGKSTFVKKFVLPRGYVHVNRDTLGTAAKCEKLLKDSLNGRKKVVVDNTNLDIETRKKIINICKQYNVPVRCFVMDASFQRCQHNNKFRVIQKSDHAVITPMVMRSSLSKFVSPGMEEGFSEIVRVPFIPSFNGELDRKLYNYHLLVPK